MMETTCYQKGNVTNWQGRIDDINDPASYRWHQVIKLLDLNKLAIIPQEKNKINICFLGYACDEGVARNKGRKGAAKGSAYIRKEMANLPVHQNLNIEFYDAGNIICKDKNLEQMSNQLALAVNQLLEFGFFPIILGGSHDLAFGHYKGLSEFINKNKQTHKIGIINFDAHFDLRAPIKNLSNSGTMFHQIAEVCSENQSSFNYFVLGIQRYANTDSLFQKAEELNVQFEYAKNISEKNLLKIKSRLDQFINQNDYIYLSLCSDVFSSAYAPGVSAPQPFGLLPEITLELIKHVINSKKIISFDLAEVAPRFDEDNRTAKLAAIVIYAIINTLAGYTI